MGDKGGFSAGASGNARIWAWNCDRSGEGGGGDSFERVPGDGGTLVTYAPALLTIDAFLMIGVE